MIRIIQPQTESEIENYFLLRWQTLRAPWNQPRGTERDDKENECIHFLALENETPMGVCRLQYNDATNAQVRFMGVAEAGRGKGIGKLLLLEAEKIAKESGHQKMILQARENAVPFYERCGYTITEKTFLLWETIQHYLMEKKL
ncbi:MAG TPA: GNAT family N-acetyltransferase [Flavobacteriales bacterium]|nr:GNAT family N-acetyltransferase [Flavobacteriales bacterium]HRE96426.1 GNAT family N-acetyltransferase [Flavobacteriales bacterium]HRJ36151.1 GNAT family N-acetyltransferase [Flavobacteriales bacterium]HRJ39880.1 GNAT family N-acetyltransferase [Flavobacteriales bacterium]